MSSTFDQLAELVAAGVLAPQFRPETFATERAALISACREAEDDIVEKARLRLQRLSFGSHPLASDPCGTPETMSIIHI